MIDISKKHNIDGLTVYSKKTSGKEIRKRTVNLEKFKEEPREVPKRKRKVWIGIGIISAILIGGLIVWFSFKKPTFTGSKVKLTLEASKEAVSGADFNYIVKYSNQEEVPLENVEIKVFYPEGFIFKESNPEAQGDNSGTWKFDRIEAGESKTITIQGKLIGDIDSTKKCKVTLAYKPQNVSSTFNQDAEVSTRITSTALALTSELPENITSGEEIIWTIKYSNTEKSEIDNIKIETVYPDGFEFESADPEPTQENVWENIKLKANEESEIKIKGKLTGNLDEKKIFKASIGIVDNQGKFWLQQEIENSIKIIEANLEINHKVNKEIVNLGSLLEYKTILKNTGSVAIENIVITNEIDSNLLDDKSLQFEKGNFENGEIIWDKNTLEALSSLDPGQEIQVSFKAKVVQNIKIEKEEDKNFVVKNKAKIEGEIGEKKNNWESDEVFSKIITDLNLRSEGHYVDYEGIQVGRGPIPPQVGKTTTYMIYWYLTNSLNDVEGTVVRSSLPENVIWTGKTTVSSGSISYNKKTREIVWKIGNLPAHTGSLIQNMEATFEVSITPVKSDIGNNLPLLNESIVSGMDTFCNVEVEDQAEAINTDLKYDIKAKGKGEVVE